jgi:hypothetical protein
MPEEVDLEELLASNPHVDPDELEKAREMLRKLRRSGVRGPGYRLAPPFSGRRVSVREDAENDSRRIHLRRSPESEPE